jgi:glutathione S-transferase
VPYLLPARDGVLYDTSALARWLDDVHPAEGGPLVPFEPALRFVASLVDEAFDELGLYLVHHNRWVHSARSNDAGARLGHELRRLLPPGTSGLYGLRFAERQVRRLPYLFSVAPAGYAVPGLAPELTAPSRPGFPPTHALLDAIWERWLGDLERVLRTQPYLLGERFTLADAAVYGQLAMNLADPTTDLRMQELAPTTHAWLCAIHDGRHASARGPLRLSETLAPLLASIAETFVPLMRQNAAAHLDARVRGVSVFNERAFFRNQALYDGTLQGTPFRHVVKTFQVAVWQELRAEWALLGPADRADVERLLPAGTMA